MCPSIDNIFKCFNYFNVKDTKVVIIAQDPYHSPGIASGLAFETTNPNCIPPSLSNIFKEIKRSEGHKIFSSSL